MTPVTLVLDRHFRGVGRIKRATGTTSRRMYDRITAMCTELYEDGRLDILRALRTGELSFLQVYEAHRKRALEQLPLGLTGQPLGRALQTWIDTLRVPEDYSQSHRTSLTTSRKYLEQVDPRARVVDLPAVLETLRESLGREHARSFNLARSAAMAYVRATLKRNHPLWLACAAVEPRKVEKVTKRRPLSPDMMRALFPHPETNKLDRVAWAMCTTGMHAKEYWGAWAIEGDCIRIWGTKRAGRVRRVPLVLPPATPPWKHRRNFEDALRDRTRDLVAYDLRRTFAHWMELAGVPRTRRRLYMGHGIKDVTDLYEEHEVAAFLEEDATKLRAFLHLDAAAPALRIVQGGA